MSVELKAKARTCDLHSQSHDSQNFPKTAPFLFSSTTYSKPPTKSTTISASNTSYRSLPPTSHPQSPPTVESSYALKSFSAPARDPSDLEYQNVTKAILPTLTSFQIIKLSSESCTPDVLCSHVRKTGRCEERCYVTCWIAGAKIGDEGMSVGSKIYIGARKSSAYSKLEEG
jgi:hypothetical protein